MNLLNLRSALRSMGVPFVTKDITGKTTGLVGPNGNPIELGTGNFIYSTNVPDNTDGSPDKTVYFRTTPINGVVNMYIKISGVYFPIAASAPAVEVPTPIPTPVPEVPAPTVMRNIEVFPVSGNNTFIYARLVYAETGRDLIIRNPITNTATLALGFRDSDNIVNANADFSAQILLTPGQEMFSDSDTCQYWLRQNSATAVPDQTVEIEKVITL